MLKDIKTGVGRRPYYLSVDMDFWGDGISAKDANWLIDLVDNARAHNVPVNMTTEHHELLPHIPSEVQVIWNVDTHNDIVGIPCNLGPGTWGDHVDLQEPDTFIWVYPNARCASRWGEGRCDDLVNVFKIKHPLWRQVKKVARPKNLEELISIEEPGHLMGIGICLSPDCLVYTYPAVINTAIYDHIRERLND